MQITICVPDELRESLERQFGSNLDRAAAEALAAAWYRAEKLSIGQVAELLGLSIYEADGLMKQMGVEAPYSLQDLQHDRETLQRLLKT